MGRKRFAALICIGMVLLMGDVLPLWAAEEAAQASAVDVQKGLTEKAYDLDTVWTLLAAFLVMWMQAGFSAVEAGFTRAKNAVNICMKNLLDFSFGSIAFWAVGFALMFSIGSGATENFMGDSGFFLTESQVTVIETTTGEDGKEVETTVEKSNFDPIGWTNVPLACKMFFQLVFAATAATIVSGAMAERTKFTSYMVYSVFITGLIYPISGHWIWGGGWLADNDFWDFAGSTVVHSVGGWLALAGAFVLGPRLGKYGPNGRPRAIPGHNIPLATLGVFILWLGWFGFNPGSTMGAARADISHIVVTTNLAAAAGVITALFTGKLLLSNWDSGMALNGALAGLVAITCPCAWVTMQDAAIIGAIAGVVVVLSILFFDRIAKVDDPVGAISVHGICGALGTLALGFFANPEAVGIEGPKQGLFYGGDISQLKAQAIGVGSVFAWCMATGLALFSLIKVTVGLRVSNEEEMQGLDVGEHGNEAYFGFQISDPAELTHYETGQPRASAMPPNGGKRFSIVVEGINESDLIEAWSGLCQPSEEPPPKEFAAIYPYLTTVQGNRFRFRGGDQQAMRDNLEKLLRTRVRVAPSTPLTAQVEE